MHYIIRFSYILDSLLLLIIHSFINLFIHSFIHSSFFHNALHHQNFLHSWFSTSTLYIHSFIHSFVKNQIKSSLLNSIYSSILNFLTRNQSIFFCIYQCIISWMPEGCYHYSTMFRWEPEGCYCCMKSMSIALFRFSMEHRWAVFNNDFTFKNLSYMSLHAINVFDKV